MASERSKKPLTVLEVDARKLKAWMMKHAHLTEAEWFRLYEEWKRAGITLGLYTEGTKKWAAGGRVGATSNRVNVPPPGTFLRGRRFETAAVGAAPSGASSTTSSTSTTRKS